MGRSTIYFYQTYIDGICGDNFSLILKFYSAKKQNFWACERRRNDGKSAFYRMEMCN